MFVTVEGVEGSGKSTLLQGLATRLASDGRDPLVTREPGGSSLGDAIRGIFLDRSLSIQPLTEILLVNAARAEHVATRIRPALDAGRIVLCDRFVDSTIAYQGYGRGVDLNFTRQICDAATGGLHPDLTFVLDVPIEVSRERTLSRRHPADRVEAEGDVFHDRVRAGFLELAGSSPRFRLLDGTLEPAALLERAVAALYELCLS
jgi:dTMP kinase